VRPIAKRTRSSRRAADTEECTQRERKARRVNGGALFYMMIQNIAHAYPVDTQDHISGRSVAPTYESLYSGSWQHPRCSRSFVA
jgi:hypothetical protein